MLGLVVGDSLEAGLAVAGLVVEDSLEAGLVAEAGLAVDRAAPVVAQMAVLEPVAP